MSSSIPLDGIFDVSSFETIAESPVAYITIAKPLSDDALPTLVAIKSASVRREYSRQPHDIRKELRILSSLSHPNIISVVGSTFEPHAASIHFWMPFIPYGLKDLLHSQLLSPYVHMLSPAPAHLPPIENFAILSRSIAYQLLSALKYLHTLESPIAHRDVKPANLLIDATGCLKLVDFGIAWTRSMDAKDLWPEDEGTMCSHVCTGPYRAPETLFSPRTYDATAVDMWCAGTTLAELFTSLRFELESGEDESDVATQQSEVPQAYIIPSDIDLSTTRGVWERDSLFNARNGTIGLAWSIFQTLGSPTDQNWPSFRTLPDASKLAFADAEPDDLRTRLPNLPLSSHHAQSSTSADSSEHTTPISVSADTVPADASCSHFSVDSAPLDLLSRLLVLEPCRRERSFEALRHPWFTPPSQLILPPELGGDEHLGKIFASFFPGKA